MAAAAPALMQEMSEEEFERRTLDVIEREFGPAGLARFIRTFRGGQTDYTAWHETAEQPSLEQIVDELESYGLMDDVSHLRQALADMNDRK